MKSGSPMRTRIAPSPTGYIHIGTLRTALYDYFLARQSGGRFILRIEDTDRERLVPDALKRLLQTLKTLGLDYDEGPYIQSERLPIYQKYAAQLVDAGHAYYCFCTEERLIKMREDQTVLKQPSKYDRLCLPLSPEEVRSRLDRQEPHVIRMKIPEGASTFIDAIRGEITFQNSEVDDQILLKSDGYPTYHLAVVVDDHLMEITHVLRGEEWISSTPKQIILHQMLGWDMPVYAHVPLILNPDKTKISKRKGDVSVESYLEKGYLPQALINFLALLGWNPTSDREIFTRDELIKLFDLSKVNKAGAVMNLEKLNWMNAQYLKRMPEEEYLALCKKWIEESPVTSHPSPDLIRRACILVRDRVQVLNQLPELTQFLFQASLEFEPSLLLWKSQTVEQTKERLSHLRDWLKNYSFDDGQAMEEDLRALMVERGWGNGDTLWPLRVALSGQKQSPGPFELLVAYGKERALERIDQALAKL